MRYKQSIRQKISLGYYVIVVMIVGLSLFSLVELNYLERKIMLGEAISEFFDTTLEIRRFEKNYFLYEQRSDYDENTRYVTRAQDLLAANLAGFHAANLAGFHALASPAQIESLGSGLARYLELMDRYERLVRRSKRQGEAADPALKIRMEGSIRKTGKDIITIAEDISKTERRNLQTLLDSSRRVMIFSILFLSLFAVVIGQVLSRIVVRPLASLEKSMELIAEGSSDAVMIDSHDQEILSLTKAFNKMLKDLDLQRRHLVQAEKLASLGTLLSGVAHELNNPLSNISSSGQILAEEMQDERTGDQGGHGGKAGADAAFAAELVSQINEQTDRARNIVRSLLEFSRDKEFKKQVLPLRALIEETIRFVRGQVPTGVAIDVAVPGDISIHADKQRIQQAFLNLLKNAMEAFPDGRGTISVKAQQRRAIDDIEDETISIYNYMKYSGKCTIEDDTVDIVISDTGTGIPLDIIPKVFDPFFTTKDVGKGSGLGLFIVHEIIEEHDGCIAVDSVPNEGTSFLIRLPVKKNG